MLLLTVTTLIGSLGVPAWAAAMLAAVGWLVHTGVLVQARGYPVDPDQVQNLLVFAGAAWAGWFCGRRARTTAAADHGVKDASRRRVPPRAASRRDAS